jgi:hypothetical protein
VAVDTSGASTASEPVSVIVQTPGGTAPADQPPAGGEHHESGRRAIFTEGTSITLSADATDPDGPESPRGVFRRRDLDRDRVADPFVVNWSGATQGPHSIRAVATDALGASTSSAPITILITARTTSSTNGGR